MVAGRREIRKMGTGVMTDELSPQRRKTIRLFLLFEGVSFMAASLTHFGMLMHGYEHRPAGTAESTIGIILLIGFALTWIARTRIRGIGTTVQAFALLGTCVGIYTIAMGIGPRTIPDIAFHVAIVVALIWGLFVTIRAKETANTPHQQPRS